LHVRLHKWPTIWTIRLLGTPRTHSASWALWAECSSRYSRSVKETVGTARETRKKKENRYFFFFLFLIFSEEYLDAALRGEAAAEQPAKQSAQASSKQSASSTQAQASAQASSSSKQSASKQSASSTQAQASARSASQQTDFDSNPEPELGKHAQAPAVNETARRLSKPIDVKRKDVVFVSDVMCAFFAALRSGALLLLLNVLLGPAVSFDGTIGDAAVSSFLSLFDGVALSHRNLIDEACRAGAASVRLLLVFDGVAVNDAKARLRPFDKAHFHDVVRALQRAHAAKDSHLVSQHLKSLVGCVRLLSTSTGCNVTGLVAAHVASRISGKSDVPVVGSTDWIAKFEAEQKVSSASADLLDKIRVVRDAHVDGAHAVANDDPHLERAAQALASARVTVNAPKPAKPRSSRKAAAAAAQVDDGASASASTAPRFDVEVAILEARGEADFAVAGAAALLARHHNTIVGVVDLDTDIAVDLAREALALANLDNIYWLQTATHGLHGVQLGALVTDKPALHWVIAAYVSGRDSSPRASTMGFGVALKCLAKLPAGALDDVARDVKGGARLRDWLPAVLRIVEPDVELTEAHLDAFDKHEQARAAARACGLRGAEALLAGTVASVNVDQLRVALGQRLPLLLGVLERYMVTRAAGAQQPQQPTWSIRHQKLGVGAFERASHADVTHARAKALKRKAAEAKADAKADATADAKAKAEAQLAREAKIAEREAQTRLESDKRHAAARARAAPAPVKVVFDEEIAARRKRRSEKRAQRAAEIDELRREARERAVKAELRAQREADKADAASKVKVSKVEAKVALPLKVNVLNGGRGVAGEPTLFSVEAPGSAALPCLRLLVQVRRTGGALPLVADFVGRSPLDRRAGAAPSTQFALFSIILPPGEWCAEVVYEGGYAATAYHGGTLRREAVALRKRLRAKAGGPPVLGLCDKFSVLPADLGNVEISTTSWPQLLDDRTNKDEFKTWRDENGTIGAVRLGLGDAGELRASAAIFCRESGANVSDLFDLRVQAELVQRQRRAPAAAAAAADDDNDNASAGEMDVDADTGAAAAATTAATSATAAAADADSRAAVVETVTPLTIVSAGARFRGEGRQFALRRSNVAVHGPCVVRVVLTATAKADEQVPVTRVIEVPVASFCFGDDKQCVLGDAVPVPPTDKSKLKAYEKLRKKVVRSDTNGPKLRAPGKMFGRDDGQAGAASGNCGTLAYHAPTDALRDDVLDKLVHIAIQLDAFESERRIGTLAKAAKTTTTPAAVAVATTTPTQQEKGKGRKGGDGAAVAVPVAVAAEAAAPSFAPSTVTIGDDNRSRSINMLQGVGERARVNEVQCAKDNLVRAVRLLARLRVALQLKADLVRVGGKAAFVPVAHRIAERLLHARSDGDDGDDSDDDSNEAAAGDDNDLDLVDVPDDEEEMGASRAAAVVEVSASCFFFFFFLFLFP
jgi:hypothetical protein